MQIKLKSKGKELLTEEITQQEKERVMMSESELISIRSQIIIQKCLSLSIFTQKVGHLKMSKVLMFGYVLQKTKRDLNRVMFSHVILSIAK
jgi:hypothetical protein